MNKYAKKLFMLFPLFILFFFKNKLVQGLYETNAYPLIYLMHNNEYIGTGNYLLKHNLINLLSIYKDVNFEGLADISTNTDSKKNKLTIDELTDIEDGTKIERVIKKRMQFINKHVNNKHLIKHSSIIYLYELINKDNFYFLLHFLYKNSNGGVIIVIPESLYIDSEEFVRINSNNFGANVGNNVRDNENENIKNIASVSNEIIEKRIRFIQSILFNLKLNQYIYFVPNNKEIEKRYTLYKDSFFFFDLTRNVTISAIKNTQNVVNMYGKHLLFFLTKDNININSIFKQKQNNETYLLSKKKTIILSVDYNNFHIISDMLLKTTSTNTSLLVMNELMNIFTKVYEKENIDYNLLFFFTNYSYGINNFIDTINPIFKESIEFIICLDNLNENDFFLYDEPKLQENLLLMRFYDILKKKVQQNLQKEMQIETQKIKIHNKLLPNMHEYFVLKKLSSITLSSQKNNFVFINKRPLIEQKLNLHNLKKHIKIIFEALYTYIKPKKIEIAGGQVNIQTDNNNNDNNNNKNNDDDDIFINYMNQINNIDSEQLLARNDELNKYKKFFIYTKDTNDLINNITKFINEYNTNINSLVIIDYKIPNERKQKFYYQTYVRIRFSMAISYIFHYLHFFVVIIFLAVVYLLVNYCLVPWFYESEKKVI
ncbi:conserved protein, unknown function [Hepatocystis sp. ex Piliocolobus tephrosceles]|nr:conserved protein, unknown function [Hepatocystis sp. ex Piliocolobus tephrosceles]